MFGSSRIRYLTVLALALMGFLSASVTVFGQTEDSFGDAAADPIKLFEQGQSAHARGQLERALEFYERAIKIRPEFPEAEYQRGSALASLGRFVDAHVAYQRAIQLRNEWPLPYSARGALFVREGKDNEAEKSFRQALKLDSKDNLALRMLAEIRLRTKDPVEALRLAQQATREPQAPVGAWLVRAMAERASGDNKSAHASLEQVLQFEPENLGGLLERAELWTAESEFERAAADLNRALKARPDDKHILSRLAYNYERAGKLEEARQFAQKAGILEPQPAVPGTINVIGSKEEIEAANSEDPATSRQALEKLLEKNPRNPMLLARLGTSYRTDDPDRSLAYYRQAAEIDPNNPDYAVGYASALVQARRFADAATLLKRVISASPEHYIAHANLATALFHLKRYTEALPEYEWVLRSRPDVFVTYYFIATAHDNLGEYPEALKAYEAFLAKADAKTNQVEIDRVNLRLPSLRRQIQLGEGTKRKKSPQ